MKKVISILLTAVFLILSLSVFALAGDSVTLSIQDEKVYAGEELTVNVFISYDSKMTGAVIDVKYDKQMLEFVSAKEGAILESSATISIRDVGGAVRFTYMSSGEPVTMDGVIFSITFKALESAVGKTDLEIAIDNPKDFVNDSLEAIDYRTDNAEITVLNNISIETTAAEEVSEEPSSSQEATEPELTETTEDDLVSEPQVDNDDGNNPLIIVLLLVGVALICFGIAIAVKKKK